MRDSAAPNGVEVGDRIRLTHMPQDPDPIPQGAEGAVTKIQYISFNWYISVKWDNNRSLQLVCPRDDFEVIS